MSNNRIVYFLFTQTPLHVGAGESVGYVDLPIQREAHTRIPIVPGSSLKGVLRDANVNEWDENLRNQLFGRAASQNDSGQAGALMIGEARVLAFPVRSAKGAFAWITCPLVLMRAKRDGVISCDVPTSVDDEKAIACSDLKIQNSDHIVLEEYTYKTSSDWNGFNSLLHELKQLINDPVWQLIEKKLVIVSDGVFQYFVQAGCPIEQHVKIDDETGTAAEGALYNEEVVPSETLFYGLIGAQTIGNSNKIEAASALDEIRKLNGKTIQVGAGETTGMGLCTFALKS